MMIPPALYHAVAWIAGITVVGNSSPAEIEAPLLQLGALSPPPSWQMPGEQKTKSGTVPGARPGQPGPRPFGGDRETPIHGGLESQHTYYGHMPIARVSRIRPPIGADP